MGFYAGDPKKLTEDMAILKPTIFPSVPRVYNLIYGKIVDGFSKTTGLKKYLIDSAVNSKLWYLKDGQGYIHSIHDAIIFSKVKQILGGKIRLMLTGSAPIASEVLDFLKICFCAPLIEGYGLTESCAGSFLTNAADPKSGHVGGPLQNVKVRLSDLPEMNYLHTSNPPRGEVCLWGPSIMPGYFLNPEKTAESIKNEWLYTGDVGEIRSNGSLRIIDRAKNIFKLSQGEYIAPEKLENVYIQSPFISQNWIYGDSLRDHIIIFIVIDPAIVKPWATSRSLELNDAILEN